jgi:hypothetical protein
MTPPRPSPGCGIQAGFRPPGAHCLAMHRVLLPVTLAALAVAASGCGSSAGSAKQSATVTTSSSSTATTGGSSPNALQAEATSAAAGDIPDNQVFLAFHNTQAGYSIKYPEGWAQRGSGSSVTFRDKNNIVRIVVAHGPAPTAAGVRADVAGLRGATLNGAPQQKTLAGKTAYKVTYSTESAPNAVTGKRVKLLVDRYYLWKSGRSAVVDLGTPVGVDNVDAYRLMIESFRWR